MRRLSVVVALVAILVMAVALPAAALELQGEHRLMASYAEDLEVRAAEALVLRHGEWWAELVLTQRWSPAWPRRIEAELSVWRTAGGWDYGAGVLWRVTERRVKPWLMVAKPW
ncbi:MAG: hypothetical protein BAA04_04930 [Firmicutes bacterium ZCTH02-B6]|nr:MAG: hypothetical protein BAA04_04930 [Firmicutes bacterium ZCTH02-B6]